MHFQYRANFIEKNTVCQLFLCTQNRWRTYFLSLDGNNNVLRDLATFHKYIVTFSREFYALWLGDDLRVLRKSKHNRFRVLRCIGDHIEFSSSLISARELHCRTYPRLLVIFWPIAKTTGNKVSFTHCCTSK